MARLVPVGAGAVRRAPGSAKGRIVIEDDFDAPLADGLLDAFEG
ncbi:MAG: hypothetical protein QF639_08685 [Rhodospirillales bacterium]|nr:hypothetical protein [Rhodospirillales bacterium]